MPNATETYIKKIKDLRYASLLKSKGYKLAGMEWSDNTGYWLFEDDKHDADDLIQAYINGDIAGNLKEFVDAQNTLRQMLFSKT